MKSKSLGKADISGFEFAKEMLKGDPTAGINFDRLQKHNSMGYIIFEYLLCEEAQSVNPYTSHPSRYWHKNKMKFLSLWKVAKDLDAILYLVNYAKRGTLHENKVLLIRVLDMDHTGIKKQEKYKLTREQFSEYFRRLNKNSLS